MTSTPTPDAASGPLRAGKAPVGTGASPLVAQLFALALICLAAVAVQHLLVLQGAATGTSWLASAVESTDGISGDTPLVLAVGVVAVVLGLLLLLHRHSHSHCCCCLDPVVKIIDSESVIQVSSHWLND